MFDVGFSEMLVIAVVALIVIGPERLPGVARTLGHLFGRMQRYVNDVKADISREMELDELRKFKEQYQDAAHSMENTIHSEIARVESGANEVGAAIEGVSHSAQSEPPPAAATHAGTGSEPGAAGKNAA